MDQRSNLPVLVVLYAASFAAAFNESIMNVALVDIMAEFGVAATTAQWLVTGYMAITAVIVALMAFLMQRFPARTLFFFAAACFVAGEAGALLAPNFGVLLAFRLVQAIGSGVFTPLMMTAVLALAPRDKMGTYLSIGSAAITLGPALAPVVSGLLVTLVGWRAVFAPPAVVVVAVALAGTVFVESFNKVGDVKLDIVSLVLAAASLPLFVYGLGAVSSDVVVGLVAVAASLALLLVVVAMMTTFSMGILLPLYFEASFGMTALVAGALTLPAIAVNAGTAIVGGRVMDRHGSWPLLPVGFLLIAAGQVVIALVSEGLALVAVVVASVFVYAGVGLVMSPSQTAGLGNLPRREHPDGVGIMNTLVMVAASFGPSLFVGVQARGVQTAAGNGAAEATAQAVGFSNAVLVAAVIAIVGLLVAFFFAYWQRERVLEPVMLVPRELDPEERPAPTLAAVMRKDPYMVDMRATVRDVALIMVQTHTSGVPIVNDERRVVGYISDGDILRAFSAQRPSDFDLGYYVVNNLDAGFETDEAFAEMVERTMQTKALVLATHRVVSFDVSTPLEEVVTKLRSKQFKKAPVVQDNRLVGTISRNDMMRYLMGVLAE